MLLNNLNIVGVSDACWIKTDRDKITHTGRDNIGLTAVKGELKIDFEGALCFPGLINSHDHLEFNLFPRLKSRKYEDYLDWGSDIHSKFKQIINDVKRIPFQTRYEYGIYKNLLNGITTAVHHGHRAGKNNGYLTIYTDYNYLHSVTLEKYWKLKLNTFFNRKDIQIHIGEGTSSRVHCEITEFIKWNIFNKNLIGIHGIKIDEIQAEAFKGVVWCPDSNLFLYGATAEIDKLKKKTSVLFGSDSAVSADWNFWNHLRSARKLKYLNSKELFSTITRNPREILGLHNRGNIFPGYQADLVIAENKGYKDSYDSFFNINPENILLIIQSGRIVLYDESIQSRLIHSFAGNEEFTGLILNGRRKNVTGRIDVLCNSIKSYYPDVQFPFEI